MAQIIDLFCRGLKTHANPLNLPPGSLVTATNCVIDKENVIEPARGQKEFGSALSAAPKKMFGYKDRVIAHFGTTLGYYSADGVTKTDYSGSYAAPTGWKMKAAMANRNFYFTTTGGVKKLDALAGPVMSAGAPRGLDGTAALSGASGFLANNTSVAYRVVWGYKDANQNLILGAPSERILVSNSAGATRDVSLTFTIPDGITTAWFYQIYRSGPSAASTSEANDELQIVLEGNPSSAQITAKSVTVVDATPDSLRGASLYTNGSQEGIAQANTAPPLAKDVTVFKDMTLYFNTEGPQRYTINLLAVGSDDFGFFDVTGDTHSNTTLDNLSSMTGIAVGQLVTGAGIPANTTVTVVGPGSQVTLSQAATATAAGVAVRFRDRITLDGVDYWANSTFSTASRYFIVTTGGTPAANIAATARSLVALVNQYASSALYGFYLSGYDDLPGQMLFEDRSVGGAAWYVTSSKGAAFSPSLQNTGTNNVSSSDAKKNGIYVSKSGQPEAVPLLNYYTAGSADEDILRGIALRDAVFVHKSDGIFRITGDSPNNLQVTLFDSTAKLLAEDSAVAFNNQIHAMTDQGAAAISDSGVQITSRDIEKDLIALFSSQYTNAAAACFGVAYESERKYLLWTVSSTSDTVATKAWVFNTFTNAWTTWNRTRTCGFVNPYDDKLYMGDGTDQLYVERKTYTLEDYADEEFAVTISASSGTTVTVNSTASAVVGQTLAQASGSVYLQAVVTEVTDATHLEVDRIVSWDAAAAKLYNPITITIKWAPIHGGNPGVLKHYPEMTVFFRSASFTNIDMSVASNFAVAGSPISLEPISTGAWGSGAWGGFPWGGGSPEVQPIRTYIPMEQQRASWLDISIDHSEALTFMAIAGLSLPVEPLTSRFR